MNNNKNTENNKMHKPVQWIHLNVVNGSINVIAYECHRNWITCSTQVISLDVRTLIGSLQPEKVSANPVHNHVQGLVSQSGQNFLNKRSFKIIQQLNIHLLIPVFKDQLMMLNNCTLHNDTHTCTIQTSQKVCMNTSKQNK